MSTEGSLFYLLGFQRSGTTLLCHLLDKHPEIVCAEEPELSKRLVFGQIEKLKNANFDSIDMSLNFYDVNPQQYLLLVDRYLNGNIDEDRFLRACYSLFDRKNSKVIGAKEVCDIASFKYNYLEQLLQFHKGDLKIVFIQRDIKGVISSFIKLGFFPPGKRAIKSSHLKSFAKQYICVVNDMARRLAEVNTHCLTYENLMYQPQKELSKIYKFLEVEFSEEVVSHVLDTPSRGIRNNYRGIRCENATSWQSILTKRQASWINRVNSAKREPVLL